MSEEDYNQNSNLRIQACAMTVTVDLVELQSYQEAMASSQSKEWDKVMKEGYNVLVRNDTWELSELPNRQAPIGC
jgi:hypothetical protein